MSAGDNRLPVLATEINTEHEAALAAISRGMAHALKAGDLLLEAKAAVRHGQWAAWLADNTGLSERTAQRYMQIARERPQLEAKTAAVADLTIRGACELIAKPPEPLSALATAAALVPGEGQSLVGTVCTIAGVDLIIITPSTYPDYYFVTHIWVSDEEDGGLARDATLTGMRKPARWQSLPEVVLVVAGIDLVGADWTQQPFTGRRDRNPIFPEDSEGAEALLEALYPDPSDPMRQPREPYPWPRNRKELRRALKRDRP